MAGSTIVADAIDPLTPPVATVSDTNDTVELSFLVKGKRTTFPVQLRAAVRTMATRPDVVNGDTIKITQVPPCQYAKFSIGKAVKEGPGVGPLKNPVDVTVVTNAGDGAI